MRELSWQERPSKRARLAAGRRSHLHGEREKAAPTDGLGSGQLPDRADGRAATKRLQSMPDATTTKKMKETGRPGFSPGYSSNVSNTVTPDLQTVLLATTLQNDISGDYEAGVNHGPSRRRHHLHQQQLAQDSYPGTAGSTWHRRKSSPYSVNQSSSRRFFLERNITSHFQYVNVHASDTCESRRGFSQRRESRKRKGKTRRSQKIRDDLSAQKGGTDQIQRETGYFRTEASGSNVPTQSVESGARPKECLNNRKEDIIPNESELNEVNQKVLKAKESGHERDGDNNSDKHVSGCADIQEPQINRQSGTPFCKDVSPKRLSAPKDSKKDEFPNEMVIQLMSDYTDSQMIVRNLRFTIEQHEKKIESLTSQMSRSEHRHQQDKSRIIARCARLKNMREEQIGKLAGMSERIEAFEKRQREDQQTINERDQQLAALNSQLTQTNETRRLELDEFEQFKLESRRVCTSQQQMLDSCLARLGRFRSAAARQRECLECSICLGVFSRPLTLGCGHTFCDVCIETNRHSAVLPDSCPLCRRFISTSVRSSVVSQLAELTQELEQCQLAELPQELE